MKRRRLFSSNQGVGRSIGQAVAAGVMALALTLGGVGTTALLVTQPTGLAVEPAAVRTAERSLAEQAQEAKAAQEAEAAGTAETVPSAVLTPAQDPAPTASQPQAEPETETAAQPQPEAQPETEPAAPAEQAAPVPAQDPVAQMAAVSMGSLEEENSLPLLLTETPALAAEDPMAPPASAQENDTAAQRAAEETEENPVMLTPDQIRQALDAGLLDETQVAGLDQENGFFRWLWELIFGKPRYSGWRTVDDKTYYYDPDTNQPVTGIQSIDGKLYYFDASGVQQPATFGVDVSKYQQNVDWAKVKQAGAEFVMIRIGYRGYGSGALVLDPMFERHFTNARNAGLRVGVYFFSQAVNEQEAMEEAQGCWYVLNGRQLDYPVYFDTEASGAPGGTGRADGLGVEDRTKCALAFCRESEALGYRAGIYASTSWFNKRLDMSQLTGYSLWNAHYGVPNPGIGCDIWQGSCTARIQGYGGDIDVNISYIG